MPIQNYIVYLFLILGMQLSVRFKKLTVPAAITGGITGLLIFQGGGLTGLAMLTLFFILGSVATGWQIRSKQQIGAAERDKGRRTSGQVLANGGIAAILGGVTWLMPQTAAVHHLMMAGSLAAATADTLSSELGTVYGRRFYNIITFKKDQRGLDGVISLEGTLIGTVGAALIAIVYSIGFGWGINFWWIVIAGAVGNIFDSVLGATLERKNLIGNNVVNFLNTLIGAVVCFLLML
ncbi:DUF92 domain-containing protein [Mucilaginibacter agri]|uniref:DUF92 domain-containing protein n=1 Tax=Mucilaginibacter agri TaxID=2695265 RepID=A0A965ZDP7_9SPHI|nr:DUF92 domain-containing protein [Mucilaginibacter agri]NCD69154.1 DUF92 domain-containing protein [Mucilaginibacter agri]